MIKDLKVAIEGNFLGLQEEDRQNGKAYILHILKDFKVVNIYVRSNMADEVKKVAINKKCVFECLISLDPDGRKWYGVLEKIA